MRGGWNKEEKGNKQGNKMAEKRAMRRVNVRRGDREINERERKKGKKQSCPTFLRCSDDRSSVA